MASPSNHNKNMTMNQLQIATKKTTSLVVRSNMMRMNQHVILPSTAIVVDRLLFSTRKSLQPSIRGRKAPLPRAVPSTISYYAKPQVFKIDKDLVTKLFNNMNATKVNYIQKRAFATLQEDYHVNEEIFDCHLRQRENEMLRHKSGPLRGLQKLCKDAIRGNMHDISPKREVKVLDIGSTPTDLPLSIAKEFPSASCESWNLCEESSTSVALDAMAQSIPNMKVNYSTNTTRNLKSLEDRSCDLITSCFGLQSMENPSEAIKEIHRVLKPGGTLALCVWEHKGTNPIVKQMMARVIKGSSNAYYPHTDSVKPHEFEKMIEKSGLKCIDIEHGEFPFNLSDIDSHSSTSAFDLVSLPIKKELASLMTSGERPYAFEDAKAAFDEAVSKGLVRRTNHGYYVDDNRFTIIIARRAYEDTDKAKHIFKKHAKANVTSHFSQSPPSNNTSLVQVKVLDSSHDPIRKFDDLLSDSFTGKHSHYSPMSAFENAVKHTIVAEGHDVEKLKVLDLNSHPSTNNPVHLLAHSFPKASIHSADFTGSLELVHEMKPHSLDIDIADSASYPESKLSTIPDGSVDIAMSAFGLHYFQDPNAAIKQIHRILKPGGSFISATWDSIALEGIANRIMTKVIGEGHTPYGFLNFDNFSKPHSMERLLHYGRLGLVKTETHEFPFVLAKDGQLTSQAFEFAILPIRHILQDLEKSGSYPNALSDARAAFDEMIENEDMMSIDKHGCLITLPNRFHVNIARRLFEDSD